MPGANCAIPECGSTRREAYVNRAIFQVPNRIGEFYEKWRKDILAVLLRFREADEALKKRIKTGNIYVCERHFTSDDIEFTSKFTTSIYCFLSLN